MTQSISDILSLSTAYLQKKGLEKPRRQAEDLLCDALKLSRLQLYVDFERLLTVEEVALCRSFLARRSRGEPLAYIQGEIGFYHCLFTVNAAVLIPRQETEILVDKIVQQLKKMPLKDKVLWDVCCGSGCIGISLKKALPDLRVVLSDLSKEALVVAKKNSERNEVEVEFVEGDLLKPFDGWKADFFVCNPPYVSQAEYEELDREVRDYEPRLALAGGKTGLEFYQRLATDLPAYLNPGACAWFEIGYRQGEAVKALFQDERWKARRVEDDWAGHDRFFFLENE